MDTPDQTVVNIEDFEHVYEPSEDSFHLIDALEQDLEKLKAKNPTFCLEVGSGSGVVITAFGMALPNCICFSTDINDKACNMTKITSVHNKVKLDVIAMDLASQFRDAQFDVILFNPPYVVTESSECKTRGIAASWAGGVKGREITDRLLDMVPKKLSKDGVFYLLLIKENIPTEVINIMSVHGYESEIVMERQLRGEYQYIIKFFRRGN